MDGVVCPIDLNTPACFFILLQPKCGQATYKQKITPENFRDQNTNKAGLKSVNRHGELNNILIM